MSNFIRILMFHFSRYWNSEPDPQTVGDMIEFRLLDAQSGHIWN